MTAVTLDYTPAIQQHAGIGRYADELTRALIALQPEDDRRLFYVDPENRVPAPPLDRIARTTLRQSNKHWRLSVLLNTYARRAMDQQLHPRSGLFHATDHLLPPFAHTRSVFTLHDLTVLKFPATHAQLNRRFLQLMLPRFLQAADAVIADSTCTQQDALALYRLSADRVRVVHLGVQARFKPIDAVSARSVQEGYRLPERFILAVSTIEPRKNLMVLLEAYPALRQSARIFTWSLPATRLAQRAVLRAPAGAGLDGQSEAIRICAGWRLARPVQPRRGLCVSIAVRRIWPARVGGDGVWHASDLQ